MKIKLSTQECTPDFGPGNFNHDGWFILKAYGLTKKQLRSLQSAFDNALAEDPKP